MLAYAKSDIGKIREINEDSFVCLPPLFVVADGMGGHVAGEIASKMAADTLRQCFAASAVIEDPKHLLEQAIHEANAQIFQFAQQNSEYAGMGTTITAAYIQDSKIYWSHVGDSRLYILRDGRLTQVTEDHSLVGELVRSGSITAEQALTHPHRNILTRALGTSEQIKVDSGITEWKAADRILICSDGLTNMLNDQDIRGTIMTGDGETGLARLVDLANAAGGLDNITAIMIINGAV